MPEHNFTPLSGRMERFSVDSELLQNRLGDPTLREILVHIPQQATSAMESGKLIPVIIYLAPFTSSGPQRAGWKAFAETLPQRHERLISEGKMKPTILVFPDTFTSLGGNQFVDSPIMGKWSSWLSQCLKPEISKRYSTNGKFALVGKSSGGYGALYNAMTQPNVWAAVASHSGDVGFDLMYKPTFAETITHIAKHESAAKYVESVVQAASLSGADFHSLMMCALAASYDPRPVTSDNILGITLPVSFEKCIIDEQSWNNWLLFDPLTLVENASHNLKGLSALYIDCGNRDQYHIQYGSRSLVERLIDLGINHQWQEFVGTHSSIDYRLDTSLPILSKALYQGN